MNEFGIDDAVPEDLDDFTLVTTDAPETEITPPTSVPGRFWALLIVGIPVVALILATLFVLSEGDDSVARGPAKNAIETAPRRQDNWSNTREQQAGTDSSPARGIDPLDNLAPDVPIEIEPFPRGRALNSGRGYIESGRRFQQGLRPSEPPVEPPKPSFSHEPSVASQGKSDGQDPFPTIGSRRSTFQQMPIPGDPVKDRTNAYKRFNSGRQLYWTGRFEESREQLKTAVENDSTQPLYLYFLALAEYRLGNHGEAKRYVTHAVRLEDVRPIANWGRLMERCQGSARVWLEKERLMAGIRE